MRVLFLDIDGVLQPFSEHRFQHSKEEVRALCQNLTARFGGDFDYDAWAGDCGSNPFWTVAAVQWDWDPEAVAELKRVLDTTGAKIVLSSTWRYFGHAPMKALFRLWGLDGYYLDDTWTEFFLGARGDESSIKQYAMFDVRKYFEEQAKEFCIDGRPIEIFEWLDRHPEVTAYAVVDDMNLSKLLGDHFVRTDCRIEKEQADKLIEILQRDDGPFLFPDAVRAMPELEVMRREPPSE